MADINRSFILAFLAEKMGFEPMQDLHPLAVFETAPLDHLGTSPRKLLYHKHKVCYFALKSR